MKVQALIDYLGSLTVTQGRFAGEKFDVLPWQRRFLRGAFKQPGESALSLARGNGKTTLLSGIACAALDGPLAVMRGEVIICASSFEQARIDFDHVRAFMGPQIHDRTLWKVWDTMQRAAIEYKPTGARVRCISSDPRRAHGLAPVLVLADEPAQWPENTAERMVAALRTSLGKQVDGSLVALGTKSADPENWFNKMLGGECEYAQEHRAPDKDPPFQKRTWLKANPSLKYMPDLEATIRREASRAKRDPGTLAAFRALRLNQGIPDVQLQLLLEAGVWAEIEGYTARKGRKVWGVDLGTSAAQSVVASFWPETGRLEALAAFPRDPDLVKRGLRDGVGALYTRCFERRELVQCGGQAVDLVELMDTALDRFGPPDAITCDRWREKELYDALNKTKIPKVPVAVRGMGFKDGAEDVRGFRRACLEDKVVPVESLLLRSAMSAARTVQDPAGNAKLAKGSEGGRRLRARDDAAAAAILAVAEGVRRAQEAGTEGVYLGLI